eukprot:Gb_30975 [translate_table: standard]
MMNMKGTICILLGIWGIITVVFFGCQTACNNRMDGHGLVTNNVLTMILNCLKSQMPNK